MNHPAHTLILSGEPAASSPTPADIPVILKHLRSHPEAYFILEYDGGFLQGFEVPEGEQTTYHLEYADLDDEAGGMHHWQSQAPVRLETIARILSGIIEGTDSWRTQIDWEVMDLSLPPDAEVDLGHFPPHDAQRLLAALDEAEIAVRMDQVSGTTFALIISAADQESANAMMAKTFNLQV